MHARVQECVPEWDLSVDSASLEWLHPGAIAQAEANTSGIGALIT